MSRTNRKPIFSAFEQVDNPVTRRADGTGLGLAISQALAERMHGKIMVESEIGQGSTFTVYLSLPVTDQPVPAREEVVARPTPYPARGAQLSGPLELGAQDGPLSGVRILVAEDNRTNQLVVQKMLSSSGADLHFAPDGKQAVDAYQNEGCDVILMDLAMPVLGGLEATRIIRRFEKERNVSQCRIIALTANAQPSDAEACLAAGMNDFLSKPFRKKELFEILKQTV